MNESPNNVGGPPKIKKIDGPTRMTPNGFETPVSASLGKEEDILANLQKRGFSKEAIEALKSGKIIKRNSVKVGDKNLILGENWEGKKPEEGH